MYGANIKTFPMYSTTDVLLKEIHLRFGKVLNPKPLVIFQENKGEETPTQYEFFQNLCMLPS
jgi:hypothetical protein